MPPKRKGVVRGPSSPALASTPRQLTMDSFFSAPPAPAISGVESPALGGEKRESLALSGIETSLSPPVSHTPPCPAAAGTMWRETPDPGSGGAGSPDEGTPSGDSLLMEVNKREGDLSSPTEVSLQGIWSLLQRMESKMEKSSEKVTKIVEKLDLLTETVEVMKRDSSAQTKQMQEDILHLQQFKVASIKDSFLINKKLEQFENFNRRLNLRILNFPQIPGILPLDLLKRYLIENLKISSNCIPPINKIYYLPNKKIPGRQEGEDEIEKEIRRENNEIEFANVTALLEQTISTDNVRATLLVSFVFEQDVNMIMKLFFKNSQKLFGEQKVWIYPDVAKTTQERRKEFLSMRQDTIKLGATFLLAYPCKCLVRYLGDKYTFFSPNHLKEFLDVKKIIKD